MPIGKIPHAVHHIIDEAQPSSYQVPPGNNWVEFAHNTKGPFEEDTLIEALGQQDLSAVKTLMFRYGSELRSLRVAPLFPNVMLIFFESGYIKSLEDLQNMRALKGLLLRLPKSNRLSYAALPLLNLKSLDIKIRKVEDIPHLVACNNFDDLRLYNWPQPDFTSMHPLLCRNLVIIRAAAQSLAGINSENLASLTVGLCSKLEDLGAVRVPNLDIDGCKILHENAIASVRGLRSLTLRGQKGFTSFDFVRSLPELRELFLAGMKVHATDFSALIESKSLRHIFICPPFKDEYVEAIARGNPRIAISSGSATFISGKRVDERDYVRLKAQLLACAGDM
jgi:hypothetical protein